MKNKRSEWKFIRCNCDDHMVQIGYDKDWVSSCLMFDIWSQTFSRNDSYNLMHRLRLAWRCIREGHFLHDQIILSRGAAIELRDTIDEYLKKLEEE